MEEKGGEKGASKGERQKSHLHMFLRGESFFLPDLTFSKARNSTSGLAKETMQGHRAGVKCSGFIVCRTKGTQQPQPDSYLLQSSSQAVGEERQAGKGKEEEVWGGGSFYTWLITVDTRRTAPAYTHLVSSL